MFAANSVKTQAPSSGCFKQYFSALRVVRSFVTPVVFCCDFWVYF